MSQLVSSSETIPPTKHPSYALLSRAHSPETASQIFNDKLRTKPLLVAPTDSTSTDKRALRRHIRLRKKDYYLQHRKPRPLSAKEKRQLGIYGLKKQDVKYEEYQGLNRLWTTYILEVLGLIDDQGKPSPAIRDGKRTTMINASAHGSLLASADFHGMKVEVVRCVDAGRVGLQGIVVRETRSTITVVTPRNEVRMILKKGAVFRVVIDLDEAAIRGGSNMDETAAGAGNGGNGGGSDNDNEQHNKVQHGNPQKEKQEKIKHDQVEAGDQEAQKSKEHQRNKQDETRITFELHGSQLEIRPVERAIRKFKWHNMNHL